MTFNINKKKIQKKIQKIIIYQSFIDKLSSVQPDFSTYSQVSIKRAVYIKRAGWNIFKK